MASALAQRVALVGRELDLIGTIAFVPGWVEDEYGNPLVPISDGANHGVSHGTWAQWRELIAGGHTDVESHAFSHANVGQIDNPAQLEHEIAGSKQLMDDSLPGHHTVAFLCPYGSCSDAAVEMARQSGYYSVRGGWKGQYMPLDPDHWWYWGMARQQLGSETPVSTANGWVDEAIAEGKWFMECIMEHPAVADTTQQLLRTSDAHGLYAKYGFEISECMTRRS